MTPAKSDRTESAVSREEGADRNRTGVRDRGTVPAGTRVDVPRGLYVYYCPICKVGTGERSWHPVGRAGLIPQTQDEHDCVRIDVSALLDVAEALRYYAGAPWNEQPDPGAFGGHTYSQRERELGYGTPRDSRVDYSIVARAALARLDFGDGA